MSRLVHAMLASSPDRGALAGALLSAERTVVLTGLQLGAREDESVVHSRSARARRATLEALLTEPSLFWDAYYPLALAIAARAPGPGHLALADLERAGVISSVITQAVDRLHARAGNRDVVEVYGNALSAVCERCGERYSLPETGALIERAADGVPRCTTPECAFPLRPSGTLWGEPLPGGAVERAWRLAAHADLFLILDSELRTVPISLLPSVPLTRGTPLVVVGETPTQYDRYAEIIIRAPSDAVLEEVARLVREDLGADASTE